MNSKRSLLGGAVSLILIVALILFYRWAFYHFFNQIYLRTYIKYGYLIMLAFTFLTLVVDLDENRDLISPHPFRYLKACWRALRVPAYTVGGDWRLETRDAHTSFDVDEQKDSALWDTLLQPFKSFSDIFDLFVSGAFFIIFIVVIFIWLLLIAPLQYFIFLFCGAPARVLMRQKRKSWHAPEEARANETNPQEQGAASATDLDGTTSKPVRMTAALAVAVLWVLSVVFKFL
ncbi:MAG: hypothetical protein WBP93_21105 [Pyrinomonadaceae bacterium]